MWAAPPLGPWTPCLCRPISFPISFTTTNPAAARCVPNKLRVNSQLRNLNLDNNSTTTTDIGNLGKTVAIAAVKSGSEAEQKQQNRKLSRAKYNRDEEENEGSSKEREKKLSGFDVLRALEKATAQKMKKRRKERDGRKGIGREDNEKLADYGKESVRPLSIKVDWGTRLDELEKRLQQLLDITAA